MLLMATQVITLVLLIFSLIFSLTPIVKDILYRDYNKYEELIYGLNQIGIKIDMYRQEYRFTPAFAFIQAV